MRLGDGQCFAVVVAAVLRCQAGDPLVAAAGRSQAGRDRMGRLDGAAVDPS